MKEVISTEKAPGAIGPYSQGIQAGRMLFISGQIPVVPETGAFAGDDIKAQTEQSLKNIGAILSKAGAGYENIVKTTVFLKSMDDFAAMNEVYASYFSGQYPARSAVEVARLPKGALVEIEAIAMVD